MIKKIWLINGALGLLMVIMCFKTYEIWQQNDDGAVVAGKDHKTVIPPPVKLRAIQHPPETEYQKAIERNLFSPNRTEIVNKPPPPSSPSPKAMIEEVKPLEQIEGKKITLFGVILFPDYRAAIINNLEETDDGNKQLKIRIGDRIGDFKLSEIRKDRIFMTRGKEKFEILLYDKENPKEAGNTNAKTKEGAKFKPTVITTSEEGKESRNQSLGKPQSSEDEFELVETPFGMVKRRKK